MKQFAFFFVLNLCFCACDHRLEKEADRVLAKVGSEKLLWSTIKSDFPIFDNEQDSLTIVNAEVEAWVRKHVIISNATLTKQDKDKLEALIEDYRGSLILADFESTWLENNNQFKVSDEEIESYYNKYKNQFLIGGPSIKGIFAKLDKNDGALEKLDFLFSKNKFEEVRSICRSNALVFFDKMEKKMLIAELHNFISKEIIDLSKLAQKKYYQKTGRDGEYFLYVDKIHMKDQHKSLSVVADDISQILIQQKKIIAFNDYKKKLIKKAYENKTAVIY